MSGILWIIIVGFIAGIIARLLSPGPNNPGGFILTTVLGIAGAFLATARNPDECERNQRQQGVRHVAEADAVHQRAVQREQRGDRIA